MTIDSLIFRPATSFDKEGIWEIIQQAILKRKKEGSTQWQNGYPNLEVLQTDIEKGYAYVAESPLSRQIVGYMAIVFDGEPSYENIQGAWLTENHSFAVIHRLAVRQTIPIKGIGTWLLNKVEDVVLERQIGSIRVDTNFDNQGMLNVFQKLGYNYCGEIILADGGIRKAFEKELKRRSV